MSSFIENKAPIIKRYNDGFVNRSSWFDSEWGHHVEVVLRFKAEGCMGSPLGSKPNHESATRVGRVPFESDAATKYS